MLSITFISIFHSMDDVKSMVAKALPNVCVLLKLVSASLTLLLSLYSFLLTGSPSSLSKISFRLSSLQLFPILLRMDSKALCKHSPVSPLIPFSTSILYTPASLSPANYTLSNFAHAVPWQSVLCYLISCRFLLQQHLHKDVLTDHPPLKQESLQGLFQTCLYFPHFFLLLSIYLNTVSLFYQNRIFLRSWICLILFHP